MFNVLDASTEVRKRRAGAFICGLFIQLLVTSALVLFGLLFPNQLQLSEKRFAFTFLELKPPEKPAVKPQPKVARVVVPKPKFPETPKLLAPPVADLEIPEIRHTIPPVPVPNPPLPAPPVAQPSPPPKAKEQVPVITGRFGGAAATVTTKRPAAEVQTGGFGSPQGLPGRAQGGNPGNVPKLGSFELPEGPGVGNGTGGRRGIPGVVASAGFGSGVAGGRGDGKTGESRVSMGDFEKTRQVAQAPAGIPHAPPAEELQPIEILFKPSPVYTEEARRLKIQGEVALSVVFQANGAIKVIGVVTSLGHGLDQAAEQAATLIRFKPAQRAGQPTDFPATLRIEFRLADQSK
jgi:TonB family protein